MLNKLVRREILLPLLGLLNLTAPAAWPTYRACLLCLSTTISCCAHVAFRSYQLRVGLSPEMFFKYLFLQSHAKLCQFLQNVWQCILVKFF
jgi:hypothetical protein